MFTTDQLDRAKFAGDQLGRGVLAAAAFVFLVVASPIVWRGAPLADDFHNCITRSELGLGGFFAASWRFMGMVRPARFLEILLTDAVCKSLPFGFAILVPLLLTFTVALQTRGLLRDLGTPAPWADFGGAIWLLQPLGTETGLWPAALHVPLGLALALTALRLHRRGRSAWAVVAVIGAAFSLEQTVLALPVATWAVVPAPRRRFATTITALLALGILVVFAIGHGSDPRMRTGLVDRLAALVNDPTFYVAYPAVGLGLHSIPLAVRWAFPVSVVVLAAGGAAGALVAKRLPPTNDGRWRDAAGAIVAMSVLAVVLNAPVFLNVPHYGSPRLFAPTWLLLAVGVPFIAARVRVPRPVWIGTAAGVFFAGAVLSLALSVSVRLVSADFNERMAQAIAARVGDGARVAVCGVRRTVVASAPRGAYSLHEFIYEWSAKDALAYYTGRRATFQLAGELWGRPCPDKAAVDAVIAFDDLLPPSRR